MIGDATVTRRRPTVAEFDAHALDLGQETIVGRYLVSVPVSGASSGGLAAGEQHYGLLWVPRDMTFDRIAIEVVAHGGALEGAYLGIWNVGTDYLPTTLVLDAGIASIAADAVVAITIDQQLTKGWYATGVLPEGTVTLRASPPSYSPRGAVATAFHLITAGGYKSSQPYVALGTFPTGTTDWYNAICVFLRVASLD